MNKEEELKELYLSWKVLQLIYYLKTTSKGLAFLVSIIIIIISISINNPYILVISVILTFIPLLMDTSKEQSLKYKELYQKVEKGKRAPKDWMDYLERTNGLNPLTKWFWEIFFKIPTSSETENTKK